MAWRFNASGDLITRSANIPAGDFTLCGFFFQTANLGASSLLFVLDDAGSPTTAAIDLETTADGQSVNVFWGNTASGSGTSSVIGALALRQWFFCALRRSGTTVTGYMKPVGPGPLKQQSATTSGTISPTVLRVGNDSSSGEAFDGRVAGLRLWNVALTDTEIQRESYQLAPIARRNSVVLGATGDRGGVDQFSGKARTLSVTSSVTYEPGPPVPLFRNQPSILKRINAPAVVADDSEARLPVPEPEEVDEEIEPRPQEALDAVLSDAPPPPPDDPEVRQWAPEPEEELEEPIDEVTFIAPEAFADGPEARDELEWQEEYDEGLLDASPETTPSQFADGPEARDYVELQEEPDEGWSEPALHPVETTFADGPEAREGAELREEEPDEPAGVEAELIDAQAQAAADPEAREAAAEPTEDDEPTLEQADAMLTAAPAAAPDDPEARDAPADQSEDEEATLEPSDSPAQAAAPDDPEARDGAVLEDTPDEDLVDQLDTTLSAPVALDDLEAREQIVDEFVVEEAANEPTIEGEHSIDDPVVLDDLGTRELVIAETDDETGDVPDTFVATFEEGVLVITPTAPIGRHPAGKRHRSLQFKPPAPPLVEPKLPEPALVSDDGDVEAVVRAFIALVWRE